MSADLKIEITTDAPLDSPQWNSLSKECSNLWQCTFYDEAQLIFNNHPVYFQCFSKEKLIGGVKLYLYESKKLPRIIRSISRKGIQVSEVLFPEQEGISFDDFFQLLKSEIFSWLEKNKVSTFYQYSFYSETEKLIKIPGKNTEWKSDIGIAEIDLTKTEDELLASIHPKHRSEIIKAEKNNLQFVFSDDLESLLNLINAETTNKGGNKLNKNFLRKEYEVLKINNCAQLVFCFHEGKILSGALIYSFGEKSFYAFGGNERNSIGAGQFLQWNIIQHLKQKGFSEYSLGETAMKKDASNLKFSEGITNFKLRFGAKQLPAFHCGYVLRPLSNSIWKMLRYIFLR